eukprot:3132435-Pyramimonas_sp.AAC.1
MVLTDGLHPVWQNCVAYRLDIPLVDVAYCCHHYPKWCRMCNVKFMPSVVWSGNLFIFANSIADT